MAFEELSILKDLGFAGGAFVLMYFLAKWLMQKMLDQNQSMIQQCNRILEFAERTVKDNTVALERMHEGLVDHMKQKDEWLKKMEDCQRNRDAKLDVLIQNHLKR